MNKKGKCPKCGSESFDTERQPNGNSICNNNKCNFSGKTTEFYKIEKEPEKPKMKFSELNFRVITDTPQRNKTILDMVNKLVKGTKFFIDDKAKSVMIVDSGLFCSLSHIDDTRNGSKEITFEEAIKLLELCEPEVKEPSGKFVEYVIDPNGKYSLTKNKTRYYLDWFNYSRVESSDHIFAGWFWENALNSRVANTWSNNRIGADINDQLSHSSQNWKYPLIPKKIRFWVKE